MENQDLKPKDKSQEQSPTRETSEAGTAVNERYVSSHPFPVTLSSSHILILKTPMFILRSLLHCPVRRFKILAELNPL